MRFKSYYDLGNRFVINAELLYVSTLIRGGWAGALHKKGVIT